VGIVAGLLHLTDDEERPARYYFGADAGIDQVVGLELAGDGLLQLLRRHAGCRHVADQREGQGAIAVEHVLASERRLAEHGDAQTVVGTEFVAGIAARRHRADPTEAAARCAGWRQRQAVVLDDRGGIAVAGSDGEHRYKEPATTQEGDWLLC